MHEKQPGPTRITSSLSTDLLLALRQGLRLDQDPYRDEQLISLLTKTTKQVAATTSLTPFVPNLWNFDRWLHSRLETTTRHEMPVLAAVNGPIEVDELVAFDKRRQVKEPQNSVIHFYIEDSRFLQALREPPKLVTQLAPFRAIVGIDVSPYSSHPAYMRASSIWFSKAICSYWQFRGLTVIPNIRWTHHVDLDLAIDGVPQKSVIAISTLGVSRSSAQRNSLKLGISQIISELQPVQLLVYGNYRPDIFDEFATHTDLTFFPTQISLAHGKRGDLNVR